MYLPPLTGIEVTMNDVQLDVLREIGNIGAGNATTALAKLVNLKIDMKVPRVAMVGFPNLAETIGNEEELMVAVLVTLSVDINGIMMFMMDKKSAKFLIEQMLAGSGMEVSDDFGDMEMSVVSEIGNIISGSYLTALSTLLNMNIDMSVPYTAVDMAAAIISVPAIEFGKIGDEVLLIQTDFGDDFDVNGFFILIPELESYGKILTALGL
ncbi:MAG: chemotaxis protein CheC [Lachnospiraceae bacterium]|nr:chemotaxis protein CheC [Lachnospiraceae bacterium]